MFHIDVIKDGDVSKVKSQTLVDGQMYVDENPVSGSDNPVTSGGAFGNTKNAVDNLATFDNEGEVVTISVDIDRFTVGRFYYIKGHFCYCYAKSSGSAKFYEYGICEALNFLKSLIEEMGE